MAERFVDLSDKPRAAVTLQLGGRSFRIARVVTGVRRLYGEFLRETGRLLEQTADIAKLSEALDAATEEAEQKRLGAEIAAASAPIEDSVERRSADIMRILRLILEKNGYEFDPEWWDENADQADIVAFIAESLNKDDPGQKKTAGLVRSLISSG